MQILNYDRGARSQRGLGHETEVFALPSIYAAHHAQTICSTKMFRCCIRDRGYVSCLMDLDKRVLECSLASLDPFRN